MEEHKNCSREELENLKFRLDDFESEVRWLRWMLAGTMVLIFALILSGLLK